MRHPLLNNPNFYEEPEGISAFRKFNERISSVNVNPSLGLINEIDIVLDSFKQIDGIYRNAVHSELAKTMIELHARMNELSLDPSVYKLAENVVPVFYNMLNPKKAKFHSVDVDTEDDICINLYAETFEVSISIEDADMDEILNSPNTYLTLRKGHKSFTSNRSLQEIANLINDL